MKQFCVSLRAGNTVPKHKWGYKLQNFPVAVSLDPLAGFFPSAILFSQSLINAGIFYLYDDKAVVILKCFLFILSITNTEIWSNERIMGPYVAHMFSC